MNSASNTNHESTVFIVDDDKAVRDSLEYLLEHEGLNVEAYVSAHDFLESAQTNDSGCLLLDVSMPGMSGLELQKILAKRHFQTPIIFITGHGDVPMSVKALKAGAFNFIEKPFDVDLLLNSIKEAMAESRRSDQSKPGEVDTAAENYAKNYYAESVVETMRFPFLVLKEDLTIASTNLALCHLFNLPCAEENQSAVDEFARFLWHLPQLRERVESVFSRNVEIHNLEIGVDYPGAGHMTLLVNVRQIRQLNAQNKRALLVMEDISQRKKIEESMFIEKERAQVTLDSIREAVVTTDTDGRVLHLNPNAEKMLGMVAAEARGQVIDKVMNMTNGENEEMISNPVYKSLSEGKTIAIKEPAILTSPNGGKISVDGAVSSLRDRNGLVIGAVLVFKDVTKQRQVIAELAHAASHDSLTGLVNRREFEKRLQRAIENSKNRNVEQILCFIDLDKFKQVNDAAGHAAGDELLKQVTVLFQTKLRDRDTLARLGGDEFCLLLENCSMEKAQEITKAMVEDISGHDFNLEGRSFRIGASMGLVPISREAKSPSDLLSQADVACYGAKRRGRSCVHIFHEN